MMSTISLPSASATDLAKYIESLGNIQGKFALCVWPDGGVRLVPEDDRSYKEASIFAAIFEFNDTYQPKNLAKDDSIVGQMHQLISNEYASQR